ncbi:hexitol phosphatase HxpB [Sphingobacterium sp.]|uniref:hexitol phosphatase HxpB n=1 Tax=Sphingobacterium sp. TaxID=341027 RepID=UPI0031E2929F
MVEAVIFDMDGILIDSEPFWRKAEKEVFGNLGIVVTEEHSSITSRMTTAEVAAYWYNFKPWADRTLVEVEREVIERVGELINQHGEIMPGVKKMLHYFKKYGYKVGLATNSPKMLVPIVLKKLSIEDYFDVTLSVDDVRSGKPSPDIYLQTAVSLSVNPARCIVFEDSKSGIAAAIAAGMTVVAVPDGNGYNAKEFDKADLKLRSLLDLSKHHLEKLNNLIK